MTAVLTQLFALLSLLTAGATGAALWAARRPAAGSGDPGHVRGAIAAVTGTATMGSLYLSEVAGYPPCELCWVQRIFMYSIAVISLVGLVRRRGDWLTSAVPLAVLGLATSIWHVIVQRLPAAGATCDPDNPCSSIWVERFGFITIPVMAGTAFAFVLAAALLHHRLTTSGSPDGADAPTPEEVPTR